MGRIAPVALMLLAASGCFVESRRNFADFYESCEATGDCRSGADSCFLVDWLDGRGRMCSLWCETDADCPSSGACYELVGDPTGARICYRRCRSSSDCGPGFTCADAIMDGEVVDSICLPQ